MTSTPASPPPPTQRSDLTEAERLAIALAIAAFLRSLPAVETADEHEEAA